jgi:hypothetical protein
MAVRPPRSTLAFPTSWPAEHSLTPKALRNIALACRVFSAATQGEHARGWRPGVAKRRQPQAMVRNTFGVVPQRTASFAGRVQRADLWVRVR